MKFMWSDIFKKILRGLLIGLFMAIFFSVFFAPMLVNLNDDSSMSKVGSIFLIVLISSAVVAFIFQVLFPNFIKWISVAFLAIIAIIFIAFNITFMHSKSLCDKSGGIWISEKQKVDYVYSQYDALDQSGNCYVSNEVYQKLSKENPVLFTIFYIFRIK